jgi:ABC-type sugar transport system ATPase subunit
MRKSRKRIKGLDHILNAMVFTVHDQVEAMLEERIYSIYKTYFSEELVGVYVAMCF